MSVRFRQYEHMENYYNMKKMIDFVRDSNIPVVATEKIHGTNYSLMTDGLDVIPCKSSSSLGTDRGYMGHGPVYDRLKDEILKLFQIVVTKYETTEEKIKNIQLYGELFGGEYDGKTSKGAKRIQKKTNYSPDNNFMAYDLKIVRTTSVFYVDFADFMELLAHLKIDIVPIIQVSNIDYIMSLEPKFETRVPKFYGLPEIANNYAEGFVIKPLKEYTFEGHRIIFKFKNPDFNEVIHMKHEKEAKTEKHLSFQQMCMVELKSYITDNRFDNLFTKLTETEDKTRLVDMMIADIIQDFKADIESSDDEYVTSIRTDDNIAANQKSLRQVVDNFVKIKLSKMAEN